MAAAARKVELVRDLGQRRGRRGARRGRRARRVDEQRVDRRPGRGAEASNIDTETGAILVGDGDEQLRHLHRLHVPGLQPVRAGSTARDPGPGRRRHDHPRHPPDLDPRPRVAGHRVLDARGERDVLRRGGGRHRGGAVHAGDVREPARGGFDGADRRRRSSRSPSAAGVDRYRRLRERRRVLRVRDGDDREDPGRSRAPAASAPRRSSSTARSSRTRPCPSPPTWPRSSSRALPRFGPAGSELRPPRGESTPLARTHTSRCVLPSGARLRARGRWVRRRVRCLHHAGARGDSLHRRGQARLPHGSRGRPHDIRSCTPSMCRTDASHTWREILSREASKESQGSSSALREAVDGALDCASRRRSWPRAHWDAAYAEARHAAQVLAADAARSQGWRHRLLPRCRRRPCYDLPLFTCVTGRSCTRAVLAPTPSQRPKSASCAPWGRRSPLTTATSLTSAVHLARASRLRRDPIRSARDRSCDR